MHAALQLSKSTCSLGTTSRKSAIGPIRSGWGSVDIGYDELLKQWAISPPPSIHTLASKKGTGLIQLTIIVRDDFSSKPSPEESASAHVLVFFLLLDATQCRWTGPFNRFLISEWPEPCAWHAQCKQETQAFKYCHMVSK